MKAIKKFATSITIMCALCLGTANAATFVWTGAGADSNDLDAADNWTATGVPASGSRLGTGSSTVGTSTDLISFDSETATALPTSNIDLRAINSTTRLPNFELLNGSLNFNQANVGGFTGSTFTIGDGDLTTLAVANFFPTVTLADTTSLTYVINADGALNIAADFSWHWNGNTVVQLNGGTINSSGHVIRNLSNSASSFISFNALGSTFTANFGGQFANLATVSGQLGDSFRDTTGLGLAAIDNGDSTFTVSVVPEPSAALLGGLGMLVLLRRRR